MIAPVADLFEEPERRVVGKRLPADWTPSPQAVRFAEGLKLDVARVAEDFRDYWTARAGAGARKTDWLATWRIWCRKEAERASTARRPAVAVTATAPDHDVWWQRVKD